MTNGLNGRRSAFSMTLRTGLGLLLAATLAACTTVEGTNALTDIGTFEREVMTSTAVGVGLVPGAAEKDEPTARAPLVLPRNMGALPAPTQSAAASLPANNNNPSIDTANLSDEDLRRLRNARVVDMRSLGGRPLTDAEAQAMTTRMSAAGMNVAGTGQRPLYLPPERYYTVVGGRDLVCQTPQGDLVPLADPRCPEEIRDAIAAAGPQARTGGSLNTMTGAGSSN